MHNFHSVLEHGLPPSSNLNHNTYSTLPRIHVRRESMAHGTKEHFNFAELSECTITYQHQCRHDKQSFLKCYHIQEQTSLTPTQGIFQALTF